MIFDTCSRCRMHESTTPLHGLKTVFVSVSRLKAMSHVSISGRKENRFHRIFTLNIGEGYHPGTCLIPENTISSFRAWPQSSTALLDVSISCCSLHWRGSTEKMRSNRSCPERICSQCLLTTSTNTVCYMCRNT